MNFRQDNKKVCCDLVPSLTISDLIIIGFVIFVYVSNALIRSTYPPLNDKSFWIS